MNYNQAVSDAFLALLKERTKENLGIYHQLLTNRDTVSEATSLLGYFGEILYHCGWRSLSATEYDPIGLALAWFQPATRRIYNNRGDIDWRYSPGAVLLADHFDIKPFEFPWQPNEAFIAAEQEEARQHAQLDELFKPLQKALAECQPVAKRWDSIYRQIALCESKAGVAPGVGFESADDFTAAMLSYSNGWLIPKYPSNWYNFDLNEMFVVPTEVRDLFYGKRTCSLSIFEGYKHYFPTVESYKAWLWTLRSRGHYAKLREMPKYWEVPLPDARIVKDDVGSNDLK